MNAKESAPTQKEFDNSPMKKELDRIREDLSKTPILKHPVINLPLKSIELPESLEICNMIRGFTMKEVREKIDRWKKKNPEFIQQFVLFFTR